MSTRLSSAWRLDREPTLRMVAVGAGGALGTVARYGIERALPAPPTGVPWGTMTANLIGSAILGAVITLVTERWPPTRYVRPFGAIGFCGGFTTFSTFAVETAQRLQHGRIGIAMLYVALSLGGGVAAAGFGVVAARGRHMRPRTIPDPDSLSTLEPPPDDPRTTSE